MKQTVRAILADIDKPESRAFDKVFERILISIDRDSTGIKSGYLAAVNEHSAGLVAIERSRR